MCETRVLAGVIVCVCVWRIRIKRWKISNINVTSSGTADEPQVVEFGHLILHQRGAVAQFRAKVLVVARAYCDRCTVRHLAQRDHFERHRQRLVGPPVRGQHGAHDVRTTGADQFARVFGQQRVQRAFGERVGFQEPVAVPRRFRQVHSCSSANGAASKIGF